MKLNTRLRLRRWPCGRRECCHRRHFHRSGWAKGRRPMGFHHQGGRKYLSVWHLSGAARGHRNGLCRTGVHRVRHRHNACHWFRSSARCGGHGDDGLMLPRYIAVARSRGRLRLFRRLDGIYRTALLWPRMWIAHGFGHFICCCCRTVPASITPCSGSEAHGALAFPICCRLPCAARGRLPGISCPGRRYLPAPTALRRYIYEKDGRRAEFGLDAEAPRQQRMWTFVDVGDERIEVEGQVSSRRRWLRRGRGPRR